MVGQRRVTRSSSQQPETLPLPTKSIKHGKKREIEPESIEEEEDDEAFNLSELDIDDTLDPDDLEEVEEEEDEEDVSSEEESEVDEKTLNDYDSLDELSTVHSDEEGDSILTHAQELKAWREAHPEKPNILAEEESDHDDFEVVLFRFSFFCVRRFGSPL